MNISNYITLKERLENFNNRITWLEYRINLLNKMNSNSYKEKIDGEIDNDYFVIMNSLLEIIVIYICSIVEENKDKNSFRYTNIRGFIEEANKEFNLNLKFKDNIVNPKQCDNCNFMKEKRDKIIAHIDSTTLNLTEICKTIEIANEMFEDIKNTYDYLCKEILGHTFKPLPVSSPNRAGNGIELLLDTYQNTSG